MLQGALPKEYNKFDPDLLRDLLRIFNRDPLRQTSGDVFGRIYKYFLNKFAMTGAQEGVFLIVIHRAYHCQYD